MLSACSALRVPQKPSRATLFVGFCSTTFLRLLENFVFLYRNRKNVIYLERYVQVCKKLMENIGKYNRTLKSLEIKINMFIFYILLYNRIEE
jgi:hypothetical protein